MIRRNLVQRIKQDTSVNNFTDTVTGIVLLPIRFLPQQSGTVSVLARAEMTNLNPHYVTLSE